MHAQISVHLFVKVPYLTDNKRLDSVFCKQREVIILIENLHHDPVHTLQQQQEKDIQVWMQNDTWKSYG